MATVVDDCFTGVWHPRESTSLWKILNPDAEDERLIAVRDDVPGLAQSLKHAQFAPIQPRSTNDWAVQIQLVKHRRAYTLLIDGMQAVEKNGIFNLMAHKGLLRNTYNSRTTNEVILSPCAVSVFVEDGERMPRKCTIEIVRGSSGLLGNDLEHETLMGRREFNPFTATDTSSDVVVVPYPTNYPSHGTISIYDLTKVYRHEYNAVGSRMFEFVGNIARLFVEFSSIPESVAVVAAPTSWSATMFARMYTFVTPAEATPEEATSAEIATFSAAVSGAIGILAITSATFGVAPLSAVFAKIVASVNLAAGGVVGVFSNPVAVVTIFYDGLKNWVRERPKPLPDKIRFTLSEFAGHFEALSELVTVSDTDTSERIKGKKFKRDTMLFNWMANELETESTMRWVLFSKASRVLSRRDRGIGKANPADLSELRSSTRASMFAELNLVVEDDELCGPPTRIRVRSAFDQDTQLLSALASGTLQNIARLETALRRFEQSIDTALVELKGDWWKSNRGTSFIHAYFFGPVFKFVTAAFTPPQKQATLESMGMRVRSTLQHIKRQIPQKFGLNFTNFHSPMQAYKRDLMRAANRKFSPLYLLNPLASDDKGVLRMLPQSTKIVVFFPSSPTGETNYAENDVDAAVSVRQSSVLTDSCKVFNEMSRGATNLLSNMKDRLPILNFTHAFYLPNSAMAFGRALNSEINFNTLHVNTPAPVQHGIDTARISEQIKARLLSITSTSSNRPTTPLEALGLPDTHYAFAASAVFCQLLSEELIASSRATDTVVNAATLVQGPLQSALERMRNAFKFVREHSTTMTSVLLSETEFMLGPRSGRDAAYILHVSGLRAVRGVEDQQAIITKLCDGGDAVVRLLSQPNGPTSSVDGNLSVARRMPSEPLSSLFIDRTTGPNAFLRISALARFAKLDITTRSNARLIWAVASSYAANYLVDPLFASTELPKLQNAPQDPLGCARALTRMAAMRLDIESDFVADTGPDYDTVDELTNGLALVSFVTPATFYAPFGYGDASPTLKFPAPAPSLFGSVPVWCKHVRWAMKQVAKPFAASSSLQPGTDAYLIEFVYEPCVLNVDTLQKTLSTPELIKVEEGTHVDAKGIYQGTRLVATVYGTIPPESATPDPGAPSFAIPSTARAAVDSLSSVFAQTGAIAPLGDVVSAILWNADRLVQGTLALLTVCETSDPIFVRLMPPGPSDERLAALNKLTAAVELAGTDVTIDEIDGRKLSSTLLNERFKIQAQAETLYAGLREFANWAEELALQKRPAFSVSWANGLDQAAFTQRVLTNPEAGTVEDLLYIAENAIRLTTAFKNEYGEQDGWGGVILADSKLESLEVARNTDKYKQAASDLTQIASELESQYTSWKDERSKEIDSILRQETVFRTNLSETTNRVASHMVISQVIACSILADTVGEPHSQLVLYGLENARLAPRFVQRMQNVLSNEIRVSDDIERDVAKLSELCGIMLSIVETSV